MKTLSQFLDESKRPVYSVGPDATVREALEVMAKHNIGALLVLDEADSKVKCITRVVNERVLNAVGC